MAQKILRNISNILGIVELVLPNGQKKRFQTAKEALAFYDKHYKGTDKVMVKTNSYKLTKKTRRSVPKKLSAPLTVVTTLKKLPKLELPRLELIVQRPTSFFEEYVEAPIKTAVADFYENDPIFGKRRVENYQTAFDSNPEYMKAMTEAGNEAGYIATLPVAVAAPFLIPEVAGALNLYGAYTGGKRLFSDEGIKKTWNHVLNSEYLDAAKSAGGDVLDIAMVLPFLNTVRRGANWLYDTGRGEALNLAINRFSPKYNSQYNWKTRLFNLTPKPNSRPDLQINTTSSTEGTYLPYSGNNTVEALNKINEMLTSKGLKPLESITPLLALGIEDFLKNTQTRFVDDNGNWRWIIANTPILDIKVSSLVSPHFFMRGRYSDSYTGPTILYQSHGLGDLKIHYDKAPYQYSLVATSPSADSNDPTLPKFISKDIVKEFSANMANAVKPGSYVSGDNSVYPIGARLKNADSPEKIRDILSTPEEILGYNGAGLSTDSYDYLLKLALRPEWELRYTAELPMVDFNGLSYYGRKYMEMLRAARKEKDPEKALMLKRQFVGEYNSHIHSINPKAKLTYIDGNGRVIIPHPFIYRNNPSNIDNTSKYSIGNGNSYGFLKGSDIIMPDHPTYTVRRFDTPITSEYGSTYVGEWEPKASNSTLKYFNNIVLPKMGNKAPDDMNYAIRFGSKSYLEPKNVFGEYNSLEGAGYYFGNTDKDGNLLKIKPRNFMDAYVHELLSHGTDRYLLSHYPLVVDTYIDFTPSAQDFATLGVADIADSNKWYEMRSTLNEVRYNLYNSIRRAGVEPTQDRINNGIDKLSDETLMNYIGDINGYGKKYLEYYKAALDKNPDAASKLVNGIRNALKTLPTTTPYIIGGGALLLGGGLNDIE